ncbi:MAG: hypothetical protein GY940_12510 [bacterium]|nr:hypothetical protein [bacterium]
MKRIIITTFLMLLSITVFAGKVATLQEIMKPGMMGIKDDKLFILQGTSIHIYSLKDYSLIKKFGRRGEGPGEFMVNPYGPPMSVFILGDRLLINSINKLSYFSFDGEYITEQPTRSGNIYTPIKDGFLVIGSTRDGDEQPLITFRLMDKGLTKVKKSLYRSKIKVGSLRNILLPMEAVHYLPLYKDRFYIVDNRAGFVIHCFDSAGEKRYSINKDYQKVKVSDDYKKTARAWFVSHPLFKRMYEAVIKDGLTFEEFYPALKEIEINDDKIYAFLNNEKDGKNLCIVMDLKGKELGSGYFTMPKKDFFTYYPRLHSVDKNRYYSLIENTDDEEWELHIETILKK